MKNNNEIKTDKGFVILYAIVLSSIILAVTLGVLNISYNEIKFSTEAKTTNDAFFAADIGVECALYYNKISGVVFIDPPGSTVINCAGVQIAVNQPETLLWDFIIPGLGSANEGCAKVTVDKRDPARHIITSKGYNIGDSLCFSSSNNRVERELQVTYTN